MLQFAVIGTSQITYQFISDASATRHYELAGILSRKTAKGEAINQHFGTQAPIYTEIQSLADAEAVEVVYIASPNALHFEQAKQLIQAGKHVIIEKPIVLNADELEELFALADEHAVYVFEAARHIHTQNFKDLTQFIQSKKTHINGGTIHYQKYSSRYDAVLAGEVPNIFSPKFGGGALKDLGVYLLYTAVAWFGEPDKATYLPQQITTGVDGRGVGVLSYENFDLTFIPSKINNTAMQSEINMGKETLVIDSIENPKNVYIKESGEKITFAPAPEGSLFDEANAFYNVITKKDIDSYRTYQRLAREVMTIYSEIR